MKANILELFSPIHGIKFPIYSSTNGCECIRYMASVEEAIQFTSLE